MQKFATTLIAGIVLSAPALAQNAFPPPNSTVNQLRPSIGCDFGGGVRNMQLFIDGQEWTQAANKNGGRIDLNPTFDVGYGTHNVEARAIGILGLPINKAWQFTIANPNANNNNNNNNPGSNSAATRTYPLADSVVDDTRPRISADFPENLRSARFYLDGQEVTQMTGITGNSVAFTPQSDLSRGNHQISTQVVYMSGNSGTQNWTFRVRPNNNNNNNGNNGSNNTQTFTNFSPPLNAQVNNPRPFLSADFGVVMDNVRIYVDKTDVTNQAQITSNRVAWNPTYDLSPGTHYARVEGRQTNNNQVQSSDWQFVVAGNGNNNGNNNGGNWNNGNNNNNDQLDVVDFGVDSPNTGDRVNASFRVIGTAPPASTVRVSIKPLPKKNKVSAFTIKADANGNYNLPVAPTWATRGMRLELTTTVVDRRGRPLADPIVTEVYRR